jgi:outer membrane protein TolC
LGSAVTFDILQEKSNYLTDSTNYVTQEVNFLNARRNLNLLMGVDVLNEYGLTDNLDVAPADFALEDLYEKMVANNSNLRNQYLNQEVFRQDVRLAKTELYPRLDLGMGASYSISRQDLTNADLGGRELDNLITKPKTLNYFANFTLSYTLFDGGRIKRAIQNAYTNENIAQIQVEQLKLSLKNELVSVYDLYNARKKLLSITSLNLETGDLNLELATERFKNGTINSFDFRTIQVNYLNTALNNVQAKYNLIDAETELIRLTGGIIETYEVEYENN